MPPGARIGYKALGKIDLKRHIFRQGDFLGWFLLIFVFAVIWEKLPQMEAKWGRPAATTRFVGIILTVPFGILLFIWAWLFVLGSLLSLLGVEQTLHIPGGW